MRILVPVDGSEPSNRAVDAAAKLAKTLKAGLKIVHVISFDQIPVSEVADYALREHSSLIEVLNTFAEEKLAAARKRAEAIGVTDIETETANGDVAEAIVDIARDNKIDMIVVGRRGRGRLAGLLLGSVSHKIASVAPCPVIVVP